MLKWLRNVLTVEIHGENDMINRATITQMKNGKFRLLGGDFGNEVIQTYSRRRDAIRGAARRGLTVY